MSDKKRNRVTRETILQDIGMSEEDIQKNGISVNNSVPFFSKHNLQLKVFDVYCKSIFKYDPPTRNHHNKITYCMVKGDHVYTLNHNLKSLQQKQDDDIKVIVKASSDYRINENKKTNIIHYD